MIDYAGALLAAVIAWVLVQAPWRRVGRRLFAGLFWLTTIATKRLLPRLKAFAAECIVAYLRDAESDAVSQLTVAEVANFRRLLDKHHGRRRVVRINANPRPSCPDSIGTSMEEARWN